MKLLFTRMFLSTLLSAAVLGSVFSQTTQILQLDGSAKRQVISAYSQQQSVRFEHLQSGENYTVFIPEDASLGDCQPEFSHIQSNAELIGYDAKSNMIRFKATASTAELILHYPCNWSESAPPRHYISINCESCAVKKTQQSPDMAVLEVQQMTAEELVRNVFIGSSCFDVDNITFSGNARQFGRFSNGLSNVKFASGMIMTTGDVDHAVGPNDQDDASSSNSFAVADPDMDSLATGTMYDLAMIEFDFTPTASLLNFSFVFASEEYCEYINTNFNDVFGFFISGPGITGTQNLAVIPTQTTPISVNTVNHIVNAGYYTHNTPASGENCENGGVKGNIPAVPPATGPAVQELQYDGFTRPLQGMIELIPCSTYHIKLAIADVGDNLRDAAVFLKAGSFDAGGEIATSIGYEHNQQSAVEGCSNGFIRFKRRSADLTLPLVVNYSIVPGGTATQGVDYTLTPGAIVIPSGQTEVIRPVGILTDNVAEGEEYFTISVPNNCSCSPEGLTFYINDHSVFNANITPDTAICAGFPLLLNASAEGGLAPYSYAWSTGDTLPSIVVTPAVSTSYTVTITDACGGSATDEVLVEVLPLVHDTVQLVFCAGGSVTLNGVVYTSETEVQDTSYQALPCGKITTYIISAATTLEGSDMIFFCAGDSVVISGQVFTESGTVVDTLLTAGNCDSIVTYTLIELPLAFSSDTLSFCAGDSLEIGGQFYFESAVVTDTISTLFGCDSILEHVLIQIPLPLKTDTITFCPGKSVVLGGITYTESTTVTLTLPAASGCDTLATYLLEQLTQPTLAKIIQLCEGDTLLLGGTAYYEPGVVTILLPATTGCDTIATYTLQYLTTAASNLNITCPASISINVGSATTGAIATYSAATAASDCVCPGIEVLQNSGLASGSNFPVGVSEICFEAKDACGQSETCCFTVTVENETACKTKVIGCIKYELLSITQNPYKNKTYRIRVTNNCAGELVYTALQLPPGIVAAAPANNSVYTAPGGNKYLVRNPSFSPFYSVRFSPQNAGIANGASDILQYTLPPQADVAFISVATRLSNQQSYETYLSTAGCPIGVTPAETQKYAPVDQLVTVFPNPSDGVINVRMAAWEGQSVALQVFNSQGQRVLQNRVTAAFEAYRIELPQGIFEGLYFLEVSTESGEKEAVKFIIKR